MFRGSDGQMLTSLFCAIGCITLFAPRIAHAYIGPGLSVGAAIVILIVLFSILLALYALVWYPIRRRMRAKKSEHEESSPS